MTIQLVRPCRGSISQRYGNKQSHNGLPHTGNDYRYYGGPNGEVTDEVFAAADGTVAYAGDAKALGWPNPYYFNPDFDRTDRVDSSAGNVVVIRHVQNGVPFYTTYSHLAAWTVRAGQSVRAGQRIGTIGDSGFSAGKHLHFELIFLPANFGTVTYGRSDPNPYFLSVSAQGTTTTPSEEDDVSAQEVLSWPIERTDGQKSTVAVELAKIGPDLAKLDTVIALLRAIAPEVTESMLNDRKQVQSLDGLWAAVAQRDAPAVVDELVAAGFAEQVLELLALRIGGK